MRSSTKAGARPGSPGARRRDVASRWSALLVLPLVAGCTNSLPEVLEGTWSYFDQVPIAVRVELTEAPDSGVIGGAGDWVVYWIAVDLVPPDGQGGPLRDLGGSLSWCTGECVVACDGQASCGTLNGVFERGFVNATATLGQPYWHFQGTFDGPDFTGAGWYDASVGGTGATWDLSLGPAG